MYQPGYAYHIKDSYFLKVNDPTLLSNKEGGKYRPTYYCMKDPNTQLLWMVPLSKRVEKYRRHHNTKVQRYGSCITIVLGSYDGEDAAFLIQNMFPITGDYISHIHTRNGNPVPVHTAIQAEIARNMKRVKEIYKVNPKIVFTDMARLESMMFAELTVSSAPWEVAADREED